MRGHSCHRQPLLSRNYVPGFWYPGVKRPDLSCPGGFSALIQGVQWFSDMIYGALVPGEQGFSALVSTINWFST